MDRPGLFMARTSRAQRLRRISGALGAIVLCGAALPSLAQTYPGTLSNTATVTLPAGVSDPDAGNNSSTDQNALQAQADLAIAKTILTPVPARAGSEVHYRIVVSNAGPSVATGVSVSDTVPAQLQGVSWTCAATGAASSCGTAAGTGNLSALITIAPTELVTLDVRGTAPALTPATIAANTASLALPSGVSDPAPGNNSATTAAIQVQPPALVANADAFGPANGHAGAANLGSVLTNDSFDGTAATAALVVVTAVTAQDGVSIAEDGTVTLAPNRPAGTVSVPYTVCQRGNPGNCQSSSASVQVVAAPLVANPDSVGPVLSSGSQQSGLGNVLLNDTFDGAVASAGTVLLTSTGNGPVSIDAGGDIVVAANAAAGSYQVSYTLCDRLNPGSCSTAVATVTVVAPAPVVDAVDDVVLPAPGASGVIGNVLANDTLGGQPASAATVTLTSTPQAPLSLSASGEILLAANAAPGSYQLSYRICQTGNAGNCDTATVSVQVAAPSVVAVGDSTSPVVAGVGATGIGNVLGNDTYNGDPASTTNVSLAPVVSQGVTINGDGSVDVAASAGVGVHTLSYTICSLASPGVCASAQLSVRVNAAPPVVDAVDDVVRPALGASGAVGNVLDNDTIGGQAASPAAVTVTATPSAALAVAADGTINLASGTAPGTYQLGYQLCQAGGTSNCDTATVTVHVAAQPVLVANPDTAGPVQAGMARTGIGQVLANDTYNGAPATTATITLTPVVEQGITINSDGSVDVAASLTAGDYTLAYRICSVLAPATCSDATLTVQVSAAPPIVDAVDDVYTVLAGSSGALGNALGNDTIGGATPTAATVVLTSVAQGPLSLDAAGQVLLASGAAAGSYRLDYQICQLGNAGNCDTATVTVQVTTPLVQANADTFGPLIAGAAQANVGNVLANDLYNDAAATTATVSLAPVSAQGISVRADGSVDVAAQVGPGSYVLTYRICSVVDPDTCSDAQLSVQVRAGPQPIDAVDDAITVRAGSSGSIGNVLGNDALGGSPATLGAIVLTATPQSPLSLDANGNVQLAAGAAAGSYGLTYQICESDHPDNCDVAVVTVLVRTPSIVANDDTAGPVVAGLAHAGIGNVLANDTYDGVLASSADVTFSQLSGGDAGISIGSDGRIDVAATATVGQHTAGYRICAVDDAGNCATAQLSVQVSAPPPTLDAVDDVFAPPTHAAGVVGNARVNDTLGGQLVQPGDVRVTPNSDGPLAIDAAGEVTLAAGTPARSYQLTYQLCAAANASNCDSATVTVHVPAGVLVAADDAAQAVASASAQDGVLNVLDNDSLDGSLPATGVRLEPVGNGPVAIAADGSVGIAANPLPGTYAVPYRLCEVLNPANCAEATLQVVIAAAPVVVTATDDAFGPVTGNIGGANVGNVLGNDLIGGAAASVANALLAPVSTGPLRVNADGSVDVAAGTGTGDYTATYTLCERDAPGNCATALVTVQVRPAVIAANDDITAPVDGLEGGLNVGNVLGNDTLGGDPATPAAVTLVPISQGGVTINADGSVDIAPNTPQGTVQITYRICETINASNCDTAIARIRVAGAALVAAADSAGPVPGNVGAVNVANVLANDSINGVGATPGNVTLSQVSGGPALTVQADGGVDVAAGLAAASYVARYRICQPLNPANCQEAEVTVDVVAPPILANADAFGPVDAAIASVQAGNVLDNDLVGGQPATPAEVTLTRTGGDAAIGLDPATGMVTVGAGTAVGSHAATYRICERRNPGNCASGTVTVLVAAAPATILAVDDRFDAVAATTGANNIGNVLANDTLHGLAATTAEVVVVASSNAHLSIDVAGQVDVAPGTPVGAYTLAYRICQTTRIDNCDTATVTVGVVAAVLVANDDTAGPFSSAVGADHGGNLLFNDTLNGMPATTATVAVVPSTQGPLTINSNGTVSVPAGTPAGSYPARYRVCELAYPSNCAEADVSVVVSAAPVVVNAMRDTFGPVASGAGGTNIGNVLVNDEVNGAPATLAVVSVAAQYQAPVRLNADGSVDVDSTALAGTYTLSYALCELADPGNCDTTQLTVNVVGAAVLATPDSFGPVDGALGSANLGNVLANDTVNGQPATTTSIRLADTVSGPLRVDSDGHVELAAGTAPGTYVLVYQICGAINVANCARAAVTVTVVRGSATVDAVDDVLGPVVGAAGGTNVGNVLTNDLANGAPATITTVTVTPASNGPLTVNANGSVDVAGNTRVGSYSLNYQLCVLGSTSDCDTATLTVNVVAAAIIANNDALGPALPGSYATGNVLANDALNGAGASLDLVSLISVGSGPLTVENDGRVLVAANAAPGTYTVRYRICERLNAGSCAEADAQVLVAAAPQPMAAADDSFGPVARGSAGVGNVLGNDTVGGLPATTANVVITPVSNAALAVAADGTVDILPAAPTGTQTLTYTVCELANPGNCASALLSVQVRDAALAAADDALGPVNGVSGAVDIGNVLANDTVEGAAASTALVGIASAAPGPVTIAANGSVSVAPNTAAGEYTASYRICELANPDNCASAVVRVQVAAGATSVAANADSFGPVGGATGSDNVGNVLANDQIEGGPATPANVSLSATDTAALSIDAQGVLHLAAGTAAGTYTIPYTICDRNDAARCASATASVLVAAATIAASADAFGPIDGSAGGSSLGNVLANDTLDGSAMVPSAVLVTSTAAAPLAIDAGGNLALAPGTAAGTYSAQYTVCERLNPGNCGSAQVTVEVVASAAIVANPDSLGPLQAGPGLGNVLDNDTVGGGPAKGLVTLVPVSSGPLSIAGDGTLSVATGTPAGTYGIVYRICLAADPTQCAQANVQVIVAAGTLLAQDDTIGPVGSGGGALGNVLGNDTLGGTPVDTTRVSLTPVAAGPLSIDANGDITLASGTATGTYTLTYTLCERSNPANCASAVLRVSVQGRVLVATDDTVGPLDGTAGAANAFNVLANDLYDGAPATASNVSLAPVAQGPLSVSADGQLSLAPGTPAGTYGLRYRICDPAAPAVCAEAMVTVSVSATAITANDDAAQTAQATAVVIAVLANDVQGAAQVNAGNVTLTQVTAPGNGAARSNGEGAVVYTPEAAFTGTDSFQYTVCESTNPGNCATATVTVTVQPNQIDIAPDSVQITSPEPAQIDVLANDTTTGAPLDRASLSIVAAPEHGSVQCNAQGICLFTPEAGYNGQDRFTYRVCDTSRPAPMCGTATVTLTISGNALLARLSKWVTSPVIKVGGLARFTVRAENASGLPITNAMLVNGIPPGFTYVPQQIVVSYDQGPQPAAAARGGGGITPASVDAPVRINAQGQEWLVSTDPLTIGGIDIAPGGSATFSFYLRAGATVTGGVYESDAILRTTEGVALTNEASAEVMLEVDPAEAESLIVGSVFADDNGNGIQDPGERGLPGVRVGSVEGLVTQTDGYGRYHLVGIAPGTSARGNNFILKVDAATLPPGAAFTTPNPRVRRITAGPPTRFDFGVRLPPGAWATSAQAGTAGRLQVGAALFEVGRAPLRPQHAAALDGMAKGLKAAPGTVIVLAGSGGDALWLRRALALRQALAERLPPASVQTLHFQQASSPPSALRGRVLHVATSVFAPDGVALAPDRTALVDTIGEAIARGDIDRVVLPADASTPMAVQEQRHRLLTDTINARLPGALRARWRLAQDGSAAAAGPQGDVGGPTP